MYDMSMSSCEHLDNYKSADGTRTFELLHSVFVVSSSSDTRKLKIRNSYCYVCKKLTPYLHTCLECVFFGCHKHIREHAKSQKHWLSIDLSYGQIFCNQCSDYVYDVDLDKIATETKMAAKIFKKRLFQLISTENTEEDEKITRNNSKRVCLEADSTTGLRGLVNLGSTCFMNCIVQALMHTPLLRDYFLSERHRCTETADSCLVCELSRLFQEFYKGACIPLPLHKLLHLIWTHAGHLAKYEQQDAHEFFLATLDVLHQHCSKALPALNNLSHDKISRCSCIIDQIFSGGLQNDVVCQKCKGVSTTIDPIWDFSLDLGPVSVDGRTPSTLIDCLERFTGAEHLGSNEKTMCYNCGSYEESTKQLTMKTLPIVVCFHLKRFQHSKGMEKISTKISFPETLDMTPFMSRPTIVTPIPSDNRYSLFAVINHLGNSINGGHYTAYVRQQRDFWYKCDDHLITRVNIPEVLDSEGYLLFYHKYVLAYE